jgi:phage baseplate assembly protein W
MATGLPANSSASPKQRAYAVDINPALDSRGELLLDSNAISASLRNILLGYVGSKSRIFDQSFGSLVYGLLGEPLDQITAFKLQSAIIQAINAAEPRVRISVADVKVEANTVLAGFVVSIQYSVVATNQHGDSKLIRHCT